MENFIEMWKIGTTWEHKKFFGENRIEMWGKFGLCREMGAVREDGDYTRRYGTLWATLHRN